MTRNSFGQQELLSFWVLFTFQMGPSSYESLLVQLAMKSVGVKQEYCGHSDGRKKWVYDKVLEGGRCGIFAVHEEPSGAASSGSDAMIVMHS